MNKIVRMAFYAVFGMGIVGFLLTPAALAQFNSLKNASLPAQKPINPAPLMPFAQQYQQYVAQIAPALRLVPVAENRLRQLDIAQDNALQHWMAFVQEWQLIQRKIEPIARLQPEWQTFQSWQVLQQVNLEIENLLDALRRYQMGASSAEETQQTYLKTLDTLAQARGMTALLNPMISTR